MSSISPVENPVTHQNVTDAINQLTELNVVALLIQGLGDNCIASAIDTDEWSELGGMIRRLSDHPLNVLNELESHMPDK